MSATGPSEESEGTPPLSGDDDEKSVAPSFSGEHVAQSPEQIRQTIRLLQCPICSSLLHEPVTLPCGKSLCKSCLPGTYLRANISYPATESRLRGLQCPFDDCGKEHVAGDCSIDVTLSKVLNLFEAELRKVLQETTPSGPVITHVVARDQWEVAGVPSLNDSSRSGQAAPGRILAIFSLAERGMLDYNAEVAYVTSVTKDHEDFDRAVLQQVQDATRAEMDCQVCYALFYDPITTPCGHTFCRCCLQRVMDHARICPVCRRDLMIQPVLYSTASPANELLVKISTSFWPDVLETRRQAILAENLPSGDGELDLPIFVCALSFPFMPTFLHVFEPRYRLMIRRALEGDRCFGMTLHHGGGSLDCGTVLQIINVEFFPDGRSLIETVGVSRFRILRSEILDGYMVAKTTKINDISVTDEEELESIETRAWRDPQASPAQNPSDTSSAQAHVGPATIADIDTMSTIDLMGFAAGFVARMQGQSVGWLTARILHIYGECPRDPARFPWWFANVLPVRDMEKYRLLSTTSVRERLKLCCGWILEWETRRW